MKTYIFYTAGDPTQEQAEALASELVTRQVEVTSIDADSRDGSALAELYDMTRRPGAVVARDDGAMVHRWLGTLPQASDISYYVHA